MCVRVCVWNNLLKAIECCVVTLEIASKEYTGLHHRGNESQRRKTDYIAFFHKRGFSSSFSYTTKRNAKSNKHNNTERTIEQKKEPGIGMRWYQIQKSIVGCTRRSVGVSIYINNLIRIRKTNPTRKGARKKCGYQTRPGKNNITITGFIGGSLEGKYIFHRNREGMEKLTLYMYVCICTPLCKLKISNSGWSSHSNPFWLWQFNEQS